MTTIVPPGDLTMKVACPSHQSAILLGGDAAATDCVGQGHLAHIGIGKHDIADERAEVAAGADELAESTASGAVSVELLRGKTALRVGAAEVRETFAEVVDNASVDRPVDSGDDFDVAGVKAMLPRTRRRDHHVATD